MLDYSKYVGMEVIMYLRRSDKSNADKPIRSIEDQEADNWKVAEKWHYHGIPTDYRVTLKKLDW